MNEVKENYNLVTETYDDLDRLIYKNYYRTVTTYLITGYSPTYKRTKKLLYQDVYVYEGKKRIQSHIKRVYQPIIEFTSLTRQNSDVTATANIACGSIVQASGFVWSDVPDKLVNLMCRPPNFLYEGFYPSTNNGGTYKFLQPNAVGQKIHTITNESGIYFKAFAQIETGVLFSKTLYVDAL